jgi:predicted transposase YbfD/YdcC
MAGKRKTKAQIWQADTEAEALTHFKDVLKALPDPRRRQGLRYPLETVVVTALMAMVCGADDAEAMQLWGETNEGWLETFLPMPHGSPTQDVFLSVFAALDPAAFGVVFRGWVELLKVRLGARGRHLAVDGKTARGSRDRAGDRPGVHTLSAWLVGAGVVVGQRQTDAKSNEIKAIPELLALLDLAGSTVSIDAMGCQTAIADAIRDGGGDYLLSVKDNQPTLHSDIIDSFADAADTTRRPVDQRPALAVERWTDTNADHGRIEEREVLVIRDLKFLRTVDRWRDLAFIAVAYSKRTLLPSGKETEGRRYFIGSSDDTVEEIAKQIRDHWSVENSLHWVLDMAFNEDRARHRAENCAANMALLRHTALNLLKTEPTERLGVDNKRKRAGWDKDYLLTVLTGDRT